MNDWLRKSSPPELIEAFMESAYQDVAFQKAFKENYWPRMPSFEELSQMPPGSFGYELARFIDRWNLDKDLFPPPVFSDRSDYLRSRFYQAHDAWHVLTGYSPSLRDEMALQAFSLAQYKQPINLLILIGGILHGLKKTPTESLSFFEAALEGYQRGLLAHPLFSAPVLERLHEPLEQVRKDLNILPPRGSVLSYEQSHSQQFSVVGSQLSQANY